MFFAADLIFWHHAIGDVGAGLSTVLGNLQVVIVPFAAWAILAERVDRRILVALPLVVHRRPADLGRAGERRVRRPPGARRAVRLPRAASPTPATSSCSARAGATCAAPPARCSTRQRWRPWLHRRGPRDRHPDLVPSWPAHAWLVTLAFSSQVLGWLLITVSLPRLPAALTSVTLTIQPVGSVLLGVVLLGEQQSALQLLGVLHRRRLVAVARRRHA